MAVFNEMGARLNFGFTILIVQPITNYKKYSVSTTSQSLALAATSHVQNILEQNNTLFGLDCSRKDP